MGKVELGVNEPFFLLESGVPPIFALVLCNNLSRKAEGFRPDDALATHITRCTGCMKVPIPTTSYLWKDKTVLHHFFFADVFCRVTHLLS